MKCTIINRDNNYVFHHITNIIAAVFYNYIRCYHCAHTMSVCSMESAINSLVLSGQFNWCTFVHWWTCYSHCLPLALLSSKFTHLARALSQTAPQWVVCRNRSRSAVCMRRCSYNQCSRNCSRYSRYVAFSFICLLSFINIHQLQTKRRKPPGTYRCHLCDSKDHFINDCPEVSLAF